MRDLKIEDIEIIEKLKLLVGKDFIGLLLDPENFTNKRTRLNKSSICRAGGLKLQEVNNKLEMITEFIRHQC